MPLSRTPSNKNQANMETEEEVAGGYSLRSKSKVANIPKANEKHLGAIPKVYYKQGHLSDGTINEGRRSLFNSSQNEVSQNPQGQHGTDISIWEKHEEFRLPDLFTTPTGMQAKFFKSKGEVADTRIWPGAISCEALENQMLQDLTPEMRSRSSYHIQDLKYDEKRQDPNDTGNPDLPSQVITNQNRENSGTKVKHDNFINTSCGNTQTDMVDLVTQIVSALAKMNVIQGNDKSRQVIEQNVKSTGSLDLVKKLPSFDGSENSHPMEFITQIEYFYRFEKISFECLRFLLANQFKGSAMLWSRAYLNSFTDFETFKQGFKEQYWSETKQLEIRLKLQSARYPE
ncbi:hypothetical protein PPYR_15404, partial [Photinus pyralis]